MVDMRNPLDVSVCKYEGKKYMGNICMDGWIILRSTLKEVIVGLYIGSN
jgi:hypothetical protein